MNKQNKIKLVEIGLLLAIVGIYSWFVFNFLAMLPDPHDPVQYIQPVAWRTLVGFFPWIDRLMIADGIKLVSFFFHRIEIAGAIYFGLINFCILSIAIVWSYLKRGFWTAFIVGFFLMISYPLLRYSNYGYPDATVALFGLVAFIFFENGKPKNIIWAGFFTTLAFFSKITGLAILLYFIYEFVRQKRFADFKLYLLGLFTGGVFVLLLTDILFGFSSLKYVFSSTGQNISANTAKRSVFRSFLVCLRPEIVLPAYLALVVFWRAYKDKLIRQIFSFALFFIGFFTLLVVSSSHIKIYPHYLYTAYIFSSIGMAFYLGNLGPKKTKTYLFILAAISLILSFLGIRFGLNNSVYLVTIKILDAPLWLQMMYASFTVLTITLMILIGLKKKKIYVFVLLILISFLGSFFASASAYSVIKSQKEKINYIYTFASSYAQIPKKEFGVYLLNRDPDFPKRINWVYRTFYDNKYDRSSFSNNINASQNKIIYLSQGEVALSQLQYLVTDDEVIAREFSSKITKINYPNRTVYIAQK